MQIKILKAMSLSFLLVMIICSSGFANVITASSRMEKLTIEGDGVNGSVSFTIKELEEMAEGEFTGTYTMRTLVEPHSGKYKGVTLAYLLKKAGLKDSAKSVKVICGDNLSMEFSVAELTEQTYVNEMDHSTLKAILAYQKDGKPLVKDKISDGYDKEAKNDGGSLRLMVGQTQKGERNSPKCLQNVVRLYISAKDIGLRFNDLGSFYSWADEAIYELVEKGVLNGIGNGKFAPDKEVSRAEFAKMMVMAHRIRTVDPVGRFSDVPKDAWHAGFVEAAANKGWLQGVGGNEFNPDGKVTRNEIAVIGVKSLEMNIDDTSQAEPPYKDSDKIPAWAKKSVAAACDKGLFDSIAVGYFNPNKAISRAEAAVIIYRTLKLKK